MSGDTIIGDRWIVHEDGGLTCTVCEIKNQYHRTDGPHYCFTKDGGYKDEPEAWATVPILVRELMKIKRSLKKE